MTSIPLDQQVAGHVFAFLLVFARIGTGFMFFPGIAEEFVMSRIRLGLALCVTFLIFVPLLPTLPVMPKDIGNLLLLLFREGLIGIFFGLLMRLLLLIIDITGAVIAIEIGLSNAMVLNPSLASQSALPSVFLGILGLTMLFVSGLDHYILRALIDTYNIFPVGVMLPPEDMVLSFSRTLSEIFMIGVQLATPFLVIGLLMNISLGFMQRLVPQVQLFIVAMPLQIWGGIFLLMVTVRTITEIWLRSFFEISSGLYK